MYCPNCGLEIQGNIKFCPNCGTPIAPVGAEPQPQPAPEPEPESAAEVPTIPDLSDPNRSMSPEEIAALFANLG